MDIKNIWHIMNTCIRTLSKQHAHTTAIQRHQGVGVSAVKEVLISISRSFSSQLFQMILLKFRHQISCDFCFSFVWKKQFRIWSWWATRRSLSFRLSTSQKGSSFNWTRTFVNNSKCCTGSQQRSRLQHGA